MVYLPNATPMTLNVLGWFSQWTRSIASPLQGRQEPENNSIKDPNWGIESFLGLVTSSPTTISYGPPGQNTAIAFGVSVDIGAVNVRVGDSSPTPTAASAFTSTTIGGEQPAEAAQPSSSLDEQSIFDSTCSPEPYEIPPLAVPALPAPDAALATVYRYRKQQGVNLGSWFLLEGWMAPSLFTCASGPAISELDVAKGWNGQSKAVLERHWDTFITEDDFAWLAGIGINTLRLPL
ncbi:Glucan 1,3-beta-glucosidase 3, partial [Serendipita sp. 411]